MGLSYALFEERREDPNSGHVLSLNLEDCKIAGISDAPDIDVQFFQEGFDHTTSGGAGIGEVAMVPVAAAIANAIYHATGFRPNELPIRPQQIMEAIG